MGWGREGGGIRKGEGKLSGTCMLLDSLPFYHPYTSQSCTSKIAGTGSRRPIGKEEAFPGQVNKTSLTLTRLLQLPFILVCSTYSTGVPASVGGIR